MKNFAIIFPGQGSQSLGMLADLAYEYPQIKTTFQEVSDLVHYDTWQLAQEGPVEKINQTIYTQILMLTADVAIYRLLQENYAIKPNMMAGHSLGEYAALTCAEALSLQDAVQLVSMRAQLMQQFVPRGSGAMAAIVGLSDEQVENICKQASTTSEHAMAANYNAIGQVVIAGHNGAVMRAIELAEKEGARLAKLIPVSVPCHCSLLKDAAIEYGKVLSRIEFKTPTTAVISNVDLSIYCTPEQMKSLLQQQLYLPVRWVEAIQLMKNRAVQTVFESGPGKVLTGLVKRIDSSITAFTTSDPQAFLKTLNYCKEELNNVG